MELKEIVEEDKIKKNPFSVLPEANIKKALELLEEYSEEISF